MILITGLNFGPSLHLQNMCMRAANAVPKLCVYAGPPEPLLLSFTIKCHVLTPLPCFRVKSDNFGHQVNSDSGLVRFILNEKVNQLSKTVKILLGRAVSSGFPLFANVWPNIPDVRSYPTLPYIIDHLLEYFIFS